MKDMVRNKGARQGKRVLVVGFNNSSNKRKREDINA